MPQVDVVSVCGGDGKVACETLAEDDIPAADQPADFPPESFFLSKEAEDDWIDRNAFMERKNSGKSSTFHSGNLSSHPNLSNQSSSFGSQRYTLCVKSKPSFLGLPKPQKAAYVEAKHRRPAAIRLFPARSQSSSTNSRWGKSAVQVAEPSSPKVSCIGRVRSRRDRSRRKKNRHSQLAEPTIKRSRSTKNHKAGFWTNFRSIFRSKGHKPARSGGATSEPPSFVAETLKKSGSVRKRDLISSPEAPGLGAVKRFSSGRRSDAWAADAWAADAEMDGGKSEPLDGGSIWQRRNGGGPPGEIRVDRKWGPMAVGPVSV